MMTCGENFRRQFAAVCLLAWVIGAPRVQADNGAPFPDGEPLWRCGLMAGAESAAARGGDPRGPGDPQPESDQTDVLNVKLEATVLPSSQRVDGKVTMTVRSRLDGLARFIVYLDPAGGAMSVSSVGGAAAGFTHLNDAVTLTLDRMYNAGQDFTVVVNYGGLPTRGIYWGSHFNGSSVVDIVATLSEPYFGRGWWPGKDVLDDKATFDIWLTVPDTLVAVSNGTLQGVDLLPASGRKRYRWRESNPMTAYLASMAVADYQLYSATYNHLGAQMPMSFYILPENNTPSWRSQADEYIIMTEVFSDLYGQYPFVNEKGGMAHTPTLGYTYMEHQTIPSMPDFGTSFINAHELGHQWWGDDVTCQTWGDIWLNEGMASYSEALWEENKPGGGAASYMARMMARYPGNADDRVYVFNVNDSRAIFSQTVYDKGAWVIHMLRGVLGDATFFQALRDYRAAHAGDSATTAEFAASVSRTAGFDLSFFFEQWIMQPGSPDYRYSWLHGSAGGRNFVILQISQSQGSRGFSPLVMPLEVAVRTAGGTRTYVVWSRRSQDSFILPLDGPPLGVTFDSNLRLLTHSRTQGAPSVGPSVCQGDMNENGSVDGADIQTFVNSVLDPSVGPGGWARSDMDFDGRARLADVSLFIEALLGRSGCGEVNAFALDALTIAGPVLTAEGVTAAFTATARFVNGTTQPVTSDAIWTVIPPGVGQFRSPGQLLIGEIGESEVQVVVRATYSLGGRTREATANLRIRPTGGAGYALSFDGQNDRVQLPSTALNGLSDFTVSCWAKTSGADGNMRTLVSGGRLFQPNEFILSNLGTGLRVYVRGQQQTFTGADLGDGVWHHFAVTRQGRALSIYIDGNLFGTGDVPLTALTVDQGGLWLGGDQDVLGGGWEAVQQYQGLIDELRIHSRALTGSEIAAGMFDGITTPPADLQGYWRMDDATGQGLLDASGNGRHGGLGDVVGSPDASDPAWTPSNAPIAR